MPLNRLRVRAVPEVPEEARGDVVPLLDAALNEDSDEDEDEDAAVSRRKASKALQQVFGPKLRDIQRLETTRSKEDSRVSRARTLSQRVFSTESLSADRVERVFQTGNIVRFGDCGNNGDASQARALSRGGRPLRGRGQDGRHHSRR